MNLLLITYSFPPAAGVGILRAFSMAKYFPGEGIRVDVLTARNAAAVGQDSGLIAQLNADVTVHRTWTLDLPFALRKAIKRSVTDPNQSTATTGTGRGGGWRGPLKRLLGNFLLPDPQVGWLPFALPAARRLIRARSIDAVLITVPPFSSVRLVVGLRRRYPVLPIVLDFRDEWLTTTLKLVSFNSNQRARTVAEVAEREAVMAATLVVCVTDAAVAELRKRYPDLPPERFACIPNGFDTPVLKRAKRSIQPGEPIVLTYIGSVYGSTDPTSVVDAILALPASLQNRLHVRFIGHIETEQYRQTLLRLGDQVELIGFLPQARALEYTRSTTYLLLITHDPINVAAKLYDYLASGVPILAAVHPEGEVRRILERTCAGRSADIYDRNSIANMLAEAIGHAESDAVDLTPDEAEIEKYRRSALNARYALLLQTLTAEEQR